MVTRSSGHHSVTTQCNFHFHTPISHAAYCTGTWAVRVATASANSTSFLHLKWDWFYCNSIWPTHVTLCLSEMCGKKSSSTDPAETGNGLADSPNSLWCDFINIVAERLARWKKRQKRHLCRPSIHITDGSSDVFHNRHSSFQASGILPSSSLSSSWSIFVYNNHKASQILHSLHHDEGLPMKNYMPWFIPTYVQGDSHPWWELSLSITSSARK